MMSKKGIYATVSLLSLLALTACGNKTSDTSSKKESTSITKPAKSSEKISSSDSSGKKAQASSQVKEGMDLEQIKAGNYAGLQGEWYELGHGRNYIPGKSGTNYKPGGNDVLTITNDTISASGMSVSGRTLTDDNGEHSLKFSESDGILKATLQDASKVAVNWSVTFYPKGSTTAFPMMEVPMIKTLSLCGQVIINIPKSLLKLEQRPQQISQKPIPRLQQVV